MVDSEEIKYMDGIKNKELKMLKRVLCRYNFKIIYIRKARSAYQIRTDKGIVCLKRMKHGRKKAQNGSYLVEELKKNNFYNTAQYIKTTDHEFFVHYKGFLFYITEWIDGVECNMDDINEAVNCTKLLANFHSASKKIDISKLYIKSNTKNWPTFFMKCIKDMNNFKNAINKKRIKNQFDENYEKFIDKSCERGLFSIKLLNESSYYKLAKNSKQVKNICHNSFYYQNIIKKDDKYYIIDLDSIVIDFAISDLGKMIRRLMFKKEYNWDFNKAKLIIDAYIAINKLSKEELEIMLSLIIFPHKFWKLGSKRYIKHKSWTESKYMKKLNKVITYSECEDKFIDDYIKYLKKM
ncbi:CotS family spore coat protein [Clostridium hydrogenum]|uniref:CotS family spore coat protein n=1 Tax=Clostridium hydrogenum TaxID=2855764 RepID=UPI001F257AC2|nr:CotS family spore coat protein [Clostridium hydrogenum]